MAKKSQVMVTPYNQDGTPGTPRPATKKETESFNRFHSYMDRVDEAVKKNSTLNWNWDHTGGGINLAYLPVTLNKTPEWTGNREVEISLGDECVCFAPYRFSKGKVEGYVTLPTKERVLIEEIALSEYSCLESFDKRFAGPDVYSEGWEVRVAEWCREHIESPDPNQVAVDIITLTVSDALRGGKR